MGGRHRHGARVPDFHDLARVQVDDQDQALDRVRVAVVAPVLAPVGDSANEPPPDFVRKAEVARRDRVDEHVGEVVDSALLAALDEARVGLCRCLCKIPLLTEHRWLNTWNLVPRDDLLVAHRDVDTVDALDLLVEHGHRDLSRYRVALGEPAHQLLRRLGQPQERKAGPLRKPLLGPNQGDGLLDLLTRERLEWVADA